MANTARSHIAKRNCAHHWNSQRFAPDRYTSKKREGSQGMTKNGHLTKLNTKWLRFRQRVKQDSTNCCVGRRRHAQMFLLIGTLYIRAALRESATDVLTKLLPLLPCRCDGVYTLVLHKDGSIPQLLHRGIRDYHTHFGFLKDLPGDVVSNAVQASERTIITVRGKCSVTADILPENYNHTHNRLYIAFDAESSRQLMKAMGNSDSIEIRAEFELTHRYFDSLHEALDTLPESAVHRLMPSQDDFSIPLRRLNKPLRTEYDELRMDNGENGEQSQALKTALVYSASDPPVLILGPCGSGKSRVLAAAAYHILRDAGASRLPTRILLCSHNASADLFIEHYFGVIKNHPSRPWQEAVIRLVPYFRKDTGSYPLLYKTIGECAKLLRYECSKHIIVVTTYNTSFDLRSAVHSHPSRRSCTGVRAGGVMSPLHGHG